jgi:hypothetical protein
LGTQGAGPQFKAHDPHVTFGAGVVVMVVPGVVVIVVPGVVVMVVKGVVVTVVGIGTQHSFREHG